MLLNVMLTLASKAGSAFGKEPISVIDSISFDILKLVCLLLSPAAILSIRICMPGVRSTTRAMRQTGGGAGRRLLLSHHSQALVERLPQAAAACWVVGFPLLVMVWLAMHEERPRSGQSLDSSPAARPPA